MDEQQVPQDLAQDEYERELVRQFAESKSNVHQFFTKIVQNPDTTKTGNLTIEELGMPNLPVRSLKELEIFSKRVWKNSKFEEYFKDIAESVTATSLSKDAILIKLSVTQKRELADMTPRRKVNRGWFGRRRETDEGQ